MTHTHSAHAVFHVSANQLTSTSRYLIELFPATLKLLTKTPAILWCALFLRLLHFRPTSKLFRVTLFFFSKQELNSILLKLFFLLLCFSQRFRYMLF